MNKHEIDYISKSITFSTNNHVSQLKRFLKEKYNFYTNIETLPRNVLADYLLQFYYYSPKPKHEKFYSPRKLSKQQNQNIS